MSSSAIVINPLHSQTSKEFKAAKGLPQHEHHINTHTLVLERISQSDLSGNNHVMENQHLLMYGPLGLCNNPACTQCSAACKAKNSRQVGSTSFNSKVTLILC